MFLDILRYTFRTYSSQANNLSVCNTFCPPPPPPPLAHYSFGF